MPVENRLLRNAIGKGKAACFAHYEIVASKQTALGECSEPLREKEPVVVAATYRARTQRKIEVRHKLQNAWKNGRVCQDSAFASMRSLGMA